jgi:hypothetical protein
MSDVLIKLDDALATIDTFKRNFEQPWKVQFSADIRALPAVDLSERIEQLEREVERRIEPEQVENLIKMADPIMTELYVAECVYRKEAEAKLSKAVEALRDMVAVAEQDGWDKAITGRQIILRNARTTLAELEGK